MSSNTIRARADFWFKAEIRSLIQKGVELEFRYPEDTMPRGVRGLNASRFKE